MVIPKFILTPYFIDQPAPGLMPLRGPGWQVNDPRLESTHLNKDKRIGVSSPDEAATRSRMLALYRPLANFVHQSIARSQMPVSLAGDCCTSIAVLAGLQRARIDPTLIWFDAHGDFNTWETTPSGFLGGMPLAMLVGRGETTLLEGLGSKPQPESRVILTDARDLDPGERQAVAGSQMTHLPNVETLLEYPLPDGPLYVHFDTDVVDAAEVPAMNYPAPGGPSAETVRAVFRRLARSGRVVAASLSSWNPDLDVDGHSQEICMSLFMELIA